MDDRAEFEQWIKDETTLPLHCIEGYPQFYKNHYTHGNWTVWQAATARQRERDAQMADGIAEAGRYKSDTTSGFISDVARFVAEAIRRQP